MIQIVIDMLRKTEFVNIEIFNLSVLELINLVFIGLIFLIVFIKKKQDLKKWIIYFLLLGVYLILHYYNTTLFQETAYPLQKANFFVESYHIFITFIIPILALLSIMKSDLKTKDIIDIIKYFAFVISFLIVILNIFKCSYQAYDNGNIIKYNLFDWFTYNGDNYYELTSKGLFYSGNQISAILLICLPITILCLYKERNIKNYFILITHILAMYMLGTKVASLGIFLVFLAFFFIYIFSYFITKKEQKPITHLVVFSIVVCGFFLVSPLGIHYRMQKINQYEDLSGEEDFKKMYTLNCNNQEEIKKEQDFITNFIPKYRDHLNIPEYILEAYPVDFDLKYWCTYLNNKDLPFNDYRIMKSNILHSIYTNNNNKYDKYLGMGYTLNYIYTEKDYSYQFYLYGIFGLLLLIGPYYFILLKNGILILKNLKQKATIENLILLMAPFLGLFTAYYSGHILERTFPLLMIAILTALSYKSLLNNKN